jgi:hypothetical protein
MCYKPDVQMAPQWRSQPFAHATKIFSPQIPTKHMDLLPECLVVEIFSLLEIKYFPILACCCRSVIMSTRYEYLKLTAYIVSNRKWKDVIASNALWLKLCQTTWRMNINTTGSPCTLWSQNEEHFIHTCIKAQTGTYTHEH